MFFFRFAPDLPQNHLTSETISNKKIRTSEIFASNLENSKRKFVNTAKMHLGF